MNPRENLRAEHGMIMKVFAVLQKMLGQSASVAQDVPDDFETVLCFLETHVDPCHHAKEETVLFPALNQQQDAEAMALVADLRADHQTGRELVQQMRRQLAGLRHTSGTSPAGLVDRAQQYINLFRKHIRQENARLLPLISERFSRQEQARMAAEFTRIEQKNPDSAILKTVQTLIGRWS